MTVLPDFADFHIILNHDKANLADFLSWEQWSQCECSRFSYKCMQEQTDLVDFLFVVDILLNYDMPIAWFQESSGWKLGRGSCVFSW